jgi:hypothetical protein
MGRNYKSAAREADALCKPTCPDVDDAFASLIKQVRDYVPPALIDDAERAIEACCEKVKSVGTEKLRDALVDACSDKQEAEEERDDARKQVENLQDEIASLRAELANALAVSA